MRQLKNSYLYSHSLLHNERKPPAIFDHLDERIALPF